LKKGSERMARWTKTPADLEKFARVHGLIGDTYPSPTLRIITMDGKTYSGPAVGLPPVEEPLQWRLSWRRHNPQGRPNDRDIDKVERITSD
jgi:hypothetical protein